MPIALVSNTVSGTNSSGTTSSAIDTTGANFIVMAVAYTGSPSISDSKGNTWNALTALSSALRLYYAINPTVGTGHTFTASGASTFAALAVAAFSGVNTSSPFDVQSTAVAYAPGSITPSQNDSLLITAINNVNPGAISATVGGGFTITNTRANVSGNSYGVGMAYLIQTTAASANPTWSNPSFGANGTVIAAFKPSAAASQSVVPLVMHHRHQMRGSR